MNNNESARTKSKAKKPTPTLPEIDLDNLTLKDIRNNPISREEIKSVVETYYQIQDMRIMSGNRSFANKNSDNDEASPLYMAFVEKRFKDTEDTIVKFLSEYAKNDPIGRWLLSIPGIGPVIASALLAYIDISKCETAGSIWSYFGITNESSGKKKGERINYNPKCKVLSWKIGQSFIKVSSNEKDIYGKLYKEKKEFYIKKNNEGGFSERAANILKTKNFKQNTKAHKAYSEGKLPDSHIVAMSQRFATKIFLSHLFDIWYEYDRGVKPPVPFVKEHLGHVHILPPPNREIVFPE